MISLLANFFFFRSVASSFFFFLPSFYNHECKLSPFKLFLSFLFLSLFYLYAPFPPIFTPYDFLLPDFFNNDCKLSFVLFFFLLQCSVFAHFFPSFVESAPPPLIFFWVGMGVMIANVLSLSSLLSFSFSFLIFFLSRSSFLLPDFSFLYYDENVETIPLSQCCD